MDDLKKRIDDLEKRLEQKILDASAQGLKFYLVPAGCAVSPVSPGSMNVLEDWTDQEFERYLEDALKRLSKNKYLTLLRKHKLI